MTDSLNDPSGKALGEQPIKRKIAIQIAGKSAMVAGGASGLGLATVRRLAQEGARVVALDLPGVDLGALKALGDSVSFVGADVTDLAAVQEAVDLANAEGILAIAVNCAGIGPGVQFQVGLSAPVRRRRHPDRQTQISCSRAGPPAAIPSFRGWHARPR